MDKANQGAPAARTTTPGPWRAEGVFVVDANGNGMRAWTASDAKLIAAAPAMADALEALLADHDALWKCSTCPRSDDARAALRLAGREANNVSAAPAAPSNSKEQP